MEDDYTLFVAGLLGTDPAHIGAALLWVVSVATIAGLVAPWLQARIPAWRDQAKLTASLHDDRAVRWLAQVADVMLTVVVLTSWLVPRFALGLRAAREAKLLEDRR